MSTPAINATKEVKGGSNAVERTPSSLVWRIFNVYTTINHSRGVLPRANVFVNVDFNFYDGGGINAVDGVVSTIVRVIHQVRPKTSIVAVADSKI